MKTQNNNQKTGKRQVSKMTLRTSVVLASIILIGVSVSAQDLWKEQSNTLAYGKMTLTLDEQAAETKNADTAIDAINSALTVQMNNSESHKNNATEATPMVENEMSNENFIQNAELQTAESADVEIARYAQQLMNTIEAEEGNTIANGMNSDRFIEDAEQQTAEEVDAQIAHYAERIMIAEETDAGLTINSNKNNDSSFPLEEQYTADGVNAQIAYFAEKIINLMEFDYTAHSENYKYGSENHNY